MSMHAKVMEDETDEEQETKSTVNFYIQPVSMKFINKKDYKPDMVYTAYVRISYFMADVQSTCIKRSPLGYRRGSVHMTFYMTGQEESDLLIQVTA